MAPITSWTPGNYPPTRRSDHVDIYESAANGQVAVPDPHCWLETRTDEAEKWVTAQRLFARTYLDKNSDKQKLGDLLRSCMDYPRFSPPTLVDDGRWYWFYNSGLQCQTILYRSKEAALPDFSKDDTVIGEPFFDPNLLAADGSASVAVCKFSRCGTYFAYQILRSGNAFSTIFVRSTASPLSQAAMDSGIGDDRLSDELRYVKFSTIAWTKDAKGFFYQRYPPVDDDVMNRIQRHTDRDAAVYYHFVGTPQSDDILILHDKDHPEWTFGSAVSEDGKYLYMQIFKDTGKKNYLWIAEIDGNQIRSGLKWKRIVNEFSADYNLITNHGSILYIKTDEGAPQYKVVKVDLAIEGQNLHDFIPEDKKAHLTHISCVNQSYFVLIYQRNVKDEIYLYSEEGTQLARLGPDFVGSASIISRESQSHFLVNMSGFNSPCTIARYDFAAPEDQRWSIMRTTRVNGLDLDDFESQQVWYESKDNTKVPMFIVRHKSTKLDGTAPVFQYGYGGFGMSTDPYFNPVLLAFLQAYGAILSVVNIRGGGEFGRDWHRAGSRENKSNVYDDFIAAAEFLVANKYTARGKIAINGISNGGLLIGATVTRAPEGLFGAAISEGGVQDYLKFCNFTHGAAWKSEYGDPSVPGDFDFMYPLSPVHNMPTGRVLPATMLMVSPDDEQVVPMHSYKLIAGLQHAAPDNPNPLLLRVGDKGGHGAGKPTDQRLEEYIDKFGFVAQSLGLVWQEKN